MFVPSTANSDDANPCRAKLSERTTGSTPIARTTVRHLTFLSCGIAQWFMELQRRASHCVPTLIGTPINQMGSVAERSRNTTATDKLELLLARELKDCALSRLAAV